MNDKSTSHPQDTWARGDAYEPYVGRWSRVVAREFLTWLGVAPGSSWLDVGCGTGALTQTILQVAAPAHVKGIDRSDGFIGHARERVRDDRARFEVGDAQALSDETASFDAAVSGLMLNFVPQPQRAASEMARVVKPGGIVAAYLWDYAGKMEFMQYFWNAAMAVDPSAVELEEGRRFPLCQPNPLAELFQSVGLAQVEVRAIEIATHFRDFADYWTPFLGGQGAAPSYAMSLSEDKLIAIRERIRARLPFASDGSIPLEARAWAVRGTRAAV
jgi:SAM-dependent methyltransferase